MFVTERYIISEKIVNRLKTLKDPFEKYILGKVVFLRTYSRVVNGKKESWLDCILRVVTGIMSIRKTHYKNNRLDWIENEELENHVEELCIYMYNMYFLPGGRNLAMGGTDLVYEKGSAFLFNCFATEMTNLDTDVGHCMDFLASGIGAGTLLNWKGQAYGPSSEFYTHVVSDDREGWVEATEALIRAFTIPGSKYPIFDYTVIRPAGAPIKGFGGSASGYKALEDCHLRINQFFKTYLEVQKTQVKSEDGEYIFSVDERAKPFIDLLTFNWEKDFYFGYDKSWFEESIDSIKRNIALGRKTYGRTRLQADIICAVASCIVAGNIRRSAIILLDDVGNVEFENLKDYYDLNPERSDIGWTSNNSVRFDCNETFSKHIPKIAESIRLNGEPGFINLINMQKYARFSKECHDDATLVNPCGEICLENKELCNLSEVFMDKCVDENGNFSMEIFLNALRLATWYSSTVALLPCHRSKTNAVLQKNRRIGVSLSGLTWYYIRYGMTSLIDRLKVGYDNVVVSNKIFAGQAGVPVSSRVTTVKPCGSISKLTGSTSGGHMATAAHMIRRVRIALDHPLSAELIKCGVPYELATPSADCYVFMFPVSYGKGIISESEVSVWEKMAFTAALQRFWSDNSVSVTVTFNQDEAKSIESVIAMYASTLKTLSMLPLCEGTYAQMPEQKLSYIDYNLFNKWVGDIAGDIGNAAIDAEPPKFCTNGTCELAIDEKETVLEENVEKLRRSPLFLQYRDLILKDFNDEVRKELNEMLPENLRMNENESLHCFLGASLSESKNDVMTSFYLAIVPNEKLSMYKTFEEYDDEILNPLLECKMFSISKEGEITCK